jgi:hypothetical protein
MEHEFGIGLMKLGNLVPFAWKRVFENRVKGAQIWDVHKSM